MFDLGETVGSEHEGPHPGIVVSRDSINHSAIGTNRSIVIVIVPATDRAHIPELYPSHVPLKKGVGGLTKDSVVLCEQVRSISVDRLIRYMGMLEEDQMKEIEHALRIVLVLPLEEP
jgi:mRNA interferase MazF